MAVIMRISQRDLEAKINSAWQAGLAQLAEEILADCNEFCKEDQHTLIASSLIHSKPSEGKLIWRTPYARRQYWEIRTSLTPGRSWKWCEAAKRKHKERWKRLAERGLRENL